MKYRDVKVSVRMFLDDFIEPPFRDYVVFYLQKIEQTLKLRVNHVFIYDDVETMKVKEFSDFVFCKGFSVECIFVVPVWFGFFRGYPNPESRFGFSENDIGCP